MAYIQISGNEHYSYASLDEADEYFDGHVLVNTWSSATDSDLSLITATRILENEPWTGSVASSTQVNSWPRVGNYRSRSRNRIMSFDSSDDEPPQIVKNAMFELAIHLIQNSSVLTNGTTVDNISVGRIQLQDLQAPSVIPARIRNMYSDLLVNGGSRTWFRSN